MELEKVIKVGYGFEGMRETSQWPDNTFVTYPPTKFQSRYANDSLVKKNNQTLELVHYLNARYE